MLNFTSMLITPSQQDAQKFLPLYFFCSLIQWIFKESEHGSRWLPQKISEGHFLPQFKKLCYSAWRRSSGCFLLNISKPFNSSVVFLLQIAVTGTSLALAYTYGAYASSLPLSGSIVHEPDNSHLICPHPCSVYNKSVTSCYFLNFIFQVFWPLMNYSCMALYSWSPHLSIYVAYSLMGHIQTRCLGGFGSAGLALLLMTVTLLLGPEG